MEDFGAEFGEAKTSVSRLVLAAAARAKSGRAGGFPLLVTTGF